MRSKLPAILALLAALSLATAGAAGSRPAGGTAPARCCFMVSVDAAGHYKDSFLGQASSQWGGEASGQWEWSTRFVVEYTGRGVQAIGGTAMATGATVSGYAYDVLLNPIPPSTELRKAHRACPAGYTGWTLGFSKADLELKRVSTARLVAAARNAGGYGRALIVGSPVRLGFACSALGGEEPGGRIANKPGGTDLQGPDVYAVKAPSIDNFLGGKSFGRACWQNVQASLPNPFPHDYEFSTILGIQFTYFPQDQLKQKLQALDAMQGKQANASAAFTKANNDRLGQPDNGSGCS